MQNNKKDKVEKKDKKVQTKKKLNTRINKDTILKVSIVLITLLFIFIIYQIFNNIILKNKKVDLSGQNYYQYFYGMYQEYGGKIDLIRDKESVQLKLESGKILNLDSTPIYYKDILRKVILPSKMEIVQPSSGTLYKIDEFSNVFQENASMYVKKFNSENGKMLDNVFLYDGEDLYFFVDETIITIGDQEITVSPLSYCIVNYRQNIEIYDYEKNEYTIIPEDIAKTVDVQATNAKRDYNINLSVDTFNMGDVDQLLIRDIEHLQQFEY